MLTAHLIHNMLCHLCSFFSIRHRIYHLYLLALVAHRVALLVDAPLIVGNHAVRSIDNSLSRAVITLKAKHLAVGIIFLKGEDILDFGPAESINGLRIIAHHADIAVNRSQTAQNHILGEVRILILIHHYMRKALCKRTTSLLIVSQKKVHIDENIVKIHHPTALELELIELVDFMETSPSGAHVSLHKFLVHRIFFPSNKIVFRIGNTGQYILGFIILIL